MSSPSTRASASRQVRWRGLFLWFASGLILTGCSVGPKYARPAAPAPPDYQEVPPNWKTAQPSAEMVKGKWWEIFQDSQLNELEEKVNVSNQTLKAAQMQFEQARAVVRINRADLYPTVTAGVSVTQERISQNRPNGTLVAKNNYTDLQLPVDVSYEPDVWGRVRHIVQAARANAQATAADVESVNLSLHAELATDYFALRTFDAEIDLLNSTVSAYQKALDLTQNRFCGGIASQVDVAQAQTQLETTRAQMVDLNTMMKYTP